METNRNSTLPGGRPSLLFVQARLWPFGGGNVVAAWMLEALRRNFDVTLLTWTPPDFAALNDAFGTSLSQEQFRLLLPSPLARRLIERIPDKSEIQRLAWLMRICKQINSRFDVLATANDEMDFGRPGVQFMHYPYLASHFQTSMRDGAWAKLRRLRRRFGPWRIISRFGFDRMRSNLTLSNSQWTAQVYRDSYQAETEVLYPPAPGRYPHVPWAERTDDLVCLSRLNDDKNHHRIIEIVRRLRRHQPHVRLHIAGAVDPSPAGQKYLSLLSDEVNRNSDWLFLHRDLSRENLMLLLSRVRYGIHLKPGEHFGITVAEMARAGIIPFVHNSGGQVEILGNPSLTFSDDEDAVERIRAMMDQDSLRESVRAGLQARSESFSAERFCSELLHRVERWHRESRESDAV